MSQPNNNDIKIVPLEQKHFAEVVELYNEAFGTKTCCICIPAWHNLKEFTRLHNQAPDKRNIAFVAMDVQSEEILGYVQLCKPGLPAFYGMHTCKKNEIYIEQISVTSRARGRGIGTKLMEYSEDFATRKVAGIDILTLDVLRGNPAIGLYERMGYEIQPKRLWKNLMSTCFVLFLMGRPYGLCHPSCGVDSMVKKI